MVFEKFVLIDSLFQQLDLFESFLSFSNKMKQDILNDIYIFVGRSLDRSIDRSINQAVIQSILKILGKRRNKNTTMYSYSWSLTPHVVKSICPILFS